MKITWNENESNAYDAVGNIIETWARNNYCTDFIVFLWTSSLGYKNELFLLEDSNSFEWKSDWYEGGDVELLGFIPINYVEVPRLKEKNGTILTALSDFDETGSRKEQTAPRILSLDETKLLHNDIIWIDYRRPYKDTKDWLPMLVDCVCRIETRKIYTNEEPIEAFVFQSGVEEVSGYYKRFVFWNKCPTPQQREAIRWDKETHE